MEMNRIWHMNKSWIARLLKLVTGIVPRSLEENFTSLVSQLNNKM
jgi:hypothetical protein